MQAKFSKPFLVKAENQKDKAQEKFRTAPLRLGLSWPLPKLSKIRKFSDRVESFNRVSMILQIDRIHPIYLSPLMDSLIMSLLVPRSYPEPQVGFR